MSAAEVAEALGGKPSGDGYLCRCPVPSHGNGRGDRNPSLLIRDGDHALLVRCLAGCDRRDVLAELRRLHLLGQREDRAEHQAADRAEHVPDTRALALWRSAEPAPGTVVERYLRGRAIAIAPPPSLRCGLHWHGGRIPMPCVVAAVQAPDRRVVAVQITLLTLDGRKASVAVPRWIIGQLGAGAVRFDKAGGVLGLAEGIETALSAMQLTGVPCWCSLSAARMSSVAIPDSVCELHLFGDADDPGRAAVARTADLHRHRRVVIHYPDHGKDFNDQAVAS